MSRAFVKDEDEHAGGDALPELPVSPHPNYVTRKGLKQLKDRLAKAQDEHARVHASPEGPERELQLAYVEREIRWLEARVESAILADIAHENHDEVQFGATVEVVDPQGKTHKYSIVGEDEAHAEKGLVSWVSPLARALTGAGVGDTVTWERPAGDLALVVKSIHYPKA